MDKSGRRFVVHFQLIEQPKNLAEKTNQKTRNYNLDLSSQRGHANHDEFARWIFPHLDPERLRAIAQRCRAQGDLEEALNFEQLAERREKYKEE